MELQLGLALPTASPNVNVPFKMFDPNSYGYEAFLKLGPYCDDINSCNSSSSSGSCDATKKRGYEEDRIVPKTLPLLLWSNQPNDDDDDEYDPEEDSSSAIFKDDGEGLVGWPPVKTAWKKVRRQIPYYGGEVNNRMVPAPAKNNGCVVGRAISNSTYVKVKMEGAAIARKIDLSVHHSFETLTTTLMTMFGISDENRKSFKLTYQDIEGDWLLAEDIPWRTFIRTLKCLKLIRSRG